MAINMNSRKLGLSYEWSSNYEQVLVSYEQMFCMLNNGVLIAKFI